MAVDTFNPAQPWGTAAAHQQANPGEWTPDLIEATTSWTAVVHAIVQIQEDLRAGVAGATQAFSRRCVEDAQMRAHLDIICQHDFHGLLLAWVMEGVRERLSTHAVPNFWRCYREVAAATPRGRPPSAAQQRRYQAAFFAAVQELVVYTRAQV